MKIAHKQNGLAIAIVLSGLITCGLCILAFYSFALPAPVKEGLTFAAYLEVARQLYYDLYQFRGPILLLLAFIPFIALWGTLRCLTCPELTRRVLAFTCATLAFYLAFTAIGYLMSPAFYDHIESTIAVRSILGLAGQSLYNSLDNPDIINSPYGPAVQVANMMFLAVIDDPITACKLRGATCMLAGFAIMTWMLFRRFPTTIALFNSFIFLVALLFFSFFSFGNRADSLLLPAAACVCLGTTLEDRKRATILLSLGLAILINTKFHTAIYVIPPLIHVLSTRGIRFLLPAVPLTCILVFMPFFWSETFPASNYLTLIATPARMNFFFITACENFAFALLLLTPLFLLRFMVLKGGKTTLSKPVSYAFWALLCCVFLICIAGSLGGAWYYYLMPFLPAITLLQGQLMESSGKPLTGKGTESLNKIAACLLLAWTLVTVTTSFAHQMKILYCITDYSASDVRKDIDAIKKAHPHQSLTMGYGNHYADPLVNLRPLLVNDSHSVYLDHNIYTWYTEHGVSEIGDRSYDRIRNHDYDLFLIPKGQEPFSDPMFDHSRYREVFLNSYRFDEASRYFELWKPKGPAAEKSHPSK